MYFASRSKLRVTNCPPWSWEVLSQICISQHWSLWSTCRCWSCAATAGIKVISSSCRKWASPYLSWKWRGEFALGVGGLWKRWKILTPFSKGNWIKYECIINTCYFRGRNAQTWKDKVICPAHAANWRQGESSSLPLTAEQSFLQVAASFPHLWPAAWNLGITARNSIEWLYQKLQICLEAPREQSFSGDFHCFLL